MMRPLRWGNTEGPVRKERSVTMVLSAGAGVNMTTVPEWRRAEVERLARERAYYEMTTRRTCQRCGRVWWTNEHHGCPDCGRDRTGRR